MVDAIHCKWCGKRIVPDGAGWIWTHVRDENNDKCSKAEPEDK